jgi:hypothetical protein
MRQNWPAGKAYSGPRFLFYHSSVRPGLGRCHRKIEPTKRQKNLTVLTRDIGALARIVEIHERRLSDLKGE